MSARPADLTNTRQEDAMVSYVGSLNYGYNDKYYAGFSFRRDGSSRLAPDARWELTRLFPLRGGSQENL